MAPPQYLTGDKAGIDAFLDRFDVSADLTQRRRLLTAECSI